MVIVLLLLSVCTMVIVVANAHNLSAQMSTNELLSMQQLLGISTCTTLLSAAPLRR